MKKIVGFLFLLVSTVQVYGQTAPACTNADFELGNLSGWIKQSANSHINADKEIVLTSKSSVPQQDPFGNIPVVAPGGNFSAQLGNYSKDGEYVSLQQTFIVSSTNPVYTYRYAIAYDNGYTATSNYPYFTVEFRDNQNFVLSNLGLRLDDHLTGPMGEILYSKELHLDVTVQPWQSVTVDLTPYAGQQMTISYGIRETDVFSIDSIAQGVGDEVRAYVDGSCFNTTPIAKCIGEVITFSNPETDQFPFGSTYFWSFGDEGSSTDKSPLHSYGTAGTYNATLTISPPANYNQPSTSFFQTYTIANCSSKIPCDSCIPRFSPLPGEKYLLSAWAKQGSSQTGTYGNAGIIIKFGGPETQTGTFRPKGDIVEGWQKIEESFTVPVDAKNITISLINDATSDDVFFDDIRIHPFNGNMKSFVYDPVTLRLLATLDENNYASIYEYDEEGTLIRLKTETEKGIQTVKEARNFKAGNGK
jgi:hypothetical protein